MSAGTQTMALGGLGPGRRRQSVPASVLKQIIPGNHALTTDMSAEDRRNSKRNSVLHLSEFLDQRDSDAGIETVERTIGLKSVIAICLAAMTGSSLVLPGALYSITGASGFLAIITSSTVVMAAAVSKCELASAMPHSGGDYVYIAQAFGPLIGTMIGLGSWFDLMLKATFGLVGFGYYMKAVLPDIQKWQQNIIGLVLLFFITLLNLAGMKKLKVVQKYATLGGILVLLIVSWIALKDTNKEHFNTTNFWANRDVRLDKDGTVDAVAFIEATGFVYMAYAGLTKICAMGSEVKNPSKNFPRGIFTSLFIFLLFFVSGYVAIVGVVDPLKLVNDYAPYHTIAVAAVGEKFAIFVTVCACIVLACMANIGLAAVARFPFAMARDGLIPPIFTKKLGNGTPYVSIIFASIVMGILFLTLDVKKLAKIASSFKLIIFMTSMVGIMVYRTKDPNFEHYNPEFRSPFYPWLQIYGICCECTLLYFMGLIGLVGISLFFFLGFVIYLCYGRYHAEFLGCLAPEAWFGILPTKFKTYEVFRREALQVRKNPLFHYDHDHASTLKSEEVHEAYDKQHESKRTGAQKGLYIHRVCLTGGPCANKYQALMYMVKALTKAGYDCYAVPSVIHTLQNGGCALPDRDNVETLKNFYIETMNLQIAMERSFTKIAQESNRPSILITDRGALDVKGFFPECWEEILEKTPWTEQYLMDRYDLVLHLQTTARGLSQFYNDPVFTRGNAIDIDTNLEQAWQGHANHVIVSNDGGLDNKLQEATAQVLNLLSKAGDKNIKRRMSTMLKGDKEIAAILDSLPNHSAHTTPRTSIAGEDNTDLQEDFQMFQRRPSDGVFDGMARRVSGQQRLSGVLDRRPSDLNALKKRLSQRQDVELEKMVDEIPLKIDSDEEGSSDGIQIGKTGVESQRANGNDENMGFGDIVSEI